MKDTKNRKELQALYAEREIIGGVYAIRNMLNDKMLLLATTDLQGSKNRFEFSQSNDSCIDLKLQKDWARQGGEQFSLEVLEDLKKGETQTAEEFKADIEVLKEIWREKLADKDFY